MLLDFSASGFGHCNADTLQTDKAPTFSTPPDAPDV
jgi:hypothetical protein